MSTHHCPDEECQTEVKKMRIEVLRWKVVSSVAGTLALMALPGALIVWANSRSAEDKYATNVMMHQYISESISRDQLLELTQADIKKEAALTKQDIQYIKDGMDEIKILLKQMRRRDK